MYRTDRRLSQKEIHTFDTCDKIARINGAMSSTVGVKTQSGAAALKDGLLFLVTYMLIQMR